jgi:tryptophan 7-halogenase
MESSQDKIQNIIIVGGGTAGWMAATYLAKSLNFDVNITVIESPDQPPIGVGEATIPTIKTEFFDRLGIAEAEWMPKLTGTYKLGIKYVDWKTPPEKGGDFYYHIFGEIPLIDEVPLTSVWIKKHLEENFNTPMANACFNSIFALDLHRAPKFYDGKVVQHYAYHFDALLLANYLKEWAAAHQIKHQVTKLVSAERNEKGDVTCIIDNAGYKYYADLFIDCSGFNSFLIEKILHEPIISYSDFLLTDRAIAVNLPDDPNNTDIRSYTTARALSAGWMWEIPLYRRSGNGYVYSSQFISDEEAERELREFFGKRAEKATFRPIKFQSRRHQRSWVNNCIGIGLSSSFLEPLESTTIYFIYAALYQLVKNFPRKEIDPVIRDKFNEKTAWMVDENSDFIGMHFKTAQRADTPFWKANKFETKIPDSLQLILDRQKAGLPIKIPTQSSKERYYSFKGLFDNFWTETNYQSIFCGVGWLPEHPYSLLDYRQDIMDKGNQMMIDIQKDAKILAKTLPTHYEYLSKLYQEEKALLK